MGIFHYIMLALFLLSIIFFIRKIRYIRKVKDKAIVLLLNKRQLNFFIVCIVILILFTVFFIKIFGFDTEFLIDSIFDILLCIILAMEEGFICITPEGVVGAALKNNGFEPKEKFRYSFTFKGRRQTECLEIYTNGLKKPSTYYGGIQNPELIRILEENYVLYVEEDYSVYDKKRKD